MTEKENEHRTNENSQALSSLVKQIHFVKSTCFPSNQGIEKGNQRDLSHRIVDVFRWEGKL